jgi:hypothetical protein
VDNTYFQVKFLFMFLAGVNMLLFHFVTYRSVSQWNTTVAIPSAAKLAGGLSIAFWGLVIFFGRWVGFTL